MAIDRYPWERDIFGREECSTTAHLREPSYYFVQSTLYPFSTAEKCTDSRSGEQSPAQVYHMLANSFLKLLLVIHLDVEFLAKTGIYSGPKMALAWVSYS